MRKKKIIEERDEARKLAEELLPYVIDYINYGLRLGENKPENHIEDDCYDCQWHKKAVLWKELFDSGEIDRILGKGNE